MNWLLQHFDWVVGFTTIICVELTIRRKWYAWLASLFNQFIWLIFILAKGQYGLLPLNILMFIQSTRGLIMWLHYKEQERDAKDRLSNTTVAP